MTKIDFYVLKPSDMDFVEQTLKTHPRIEYVKRVKAPQKGKD